MHDFPYSYLLAGALVLFILSLSIYYYLATRPRDGTVEWIHMKEEIGPSFRFIGGRHPLDRWDILVIALVVICWSGIAFWNLGDREAPQTFHRFEHEYVEIDLGEETNLGRIQFYTGLNTGFYDLYFSRDRHYWTFQGHAAMDQNFADLFKWREARFYDGDSVRYIRLSARGNYILYLGELAFYDGSLQRLDPAAFTLIWSDPARASNALFDEQHTVPERSTYRNSAYFDEIYHARTAFEHLTGVYPYENSHPPLGKVLISLGIHLFGMTPFGWRFMGALFGVLILAFFYVLVRSLFGNRFVAICGTLVLAFDFMLFVKTRIATIDTYSFFFVMLQFFFIYRYISLDYESPFKKALLPLGFAGLAFGLGAAAKWTSLYFAPALVLLFAIYLFLRGRHWVTSGRKQEFVRYLVKTLGICCVFFLLIPGIIYYLSYIPYGQAVGYAPFTRGYWDLVIGNQVFMLTYHAVWVLTAEHPFSSYWWQWIFNLKPILYYLNHFPDGTRAAISAFGNPLVYWAGFLAVLTMPFAAWYRKDGRAFAIFLGYLSVLAPWLFIDRITFAYHYFLNSMFLALALSYIFNRLVQRGRGPYRAAILTFVGVVIALFVLFYPALSGMPVPGWYSSRLLQWFANWHV